MQYYQITYQIGENDEHIYPDAIKGVVFNVTQGHFKDKVMVGGTEAKIKADGKEVVLLSEKAALTLIDKFKKSFPKLKEDEILLPPKV